MSFDLLSAECLASVKHTPLARLDRLLDWPRLRTIIKERVGERGQKPTGRPAYSDEQLLRLVVLRLMHLCSANEAAEALRARLDWRLFARFNLTDDLPDVSTLNRYWRALAQVDALQEVLRVVRQCAAREGLKLVPRRGPPAPYPGLRRGADDAVWTVEGKDQWPADVGSSTAPFQNGCRPVTPWTESGNPP